MSDYFPVCKHFIKNIMMQKIKIFVHLLKKTFPVTILLVISEIYFSLHVVWPLLGILGLSLRN